MASTHDEQVVNCIDNLIAAHPMLFAGRKFAYSKPFLGAGWYAIADSMCHDVEQLLGVAAARFRPIKATAMSGSWRLDWWLNQTPEEAAEQRCRWIPSIEAVAFDIGDAVPPPYRAPCEEDVEYSSTPAGYRISSLPADKLGRAVHKRVRQAEIATESTCMWCGEPGRFWRTSWIHVACEKHHRHDAVTIEEWTRAYEARQSKRGDDDGR